MFCMRFSLSVRTSTLKNEHMAQKGISAHDRFIRKAFTEPEVAEEFFKHYLPPEIQKSIDFSSLSLQKNSFIDDKLRMQIADLLYSANFNDKPGYLYVLLEHTSSHDKFLPYRMLKYTLAIMDQHLKKYPGSDLPFVYPLILYTGGKRYRHSTRIYDLFGNHKTLAQKVYSKPYKIVDLTQVEEDTIRKWQWFSAAAILAKHIRNPNISDVLQMVMPEFNHLESEGKIEYLYASISYMMEAGSNENRDLFIEQLKAGLCTIKEDDMITIADH